MGEELYENGERGVSGVPEGVESWAVRSDAVEPSWGDSDDLTSLTVEELKSLLVRFDEEEKAISYRRRVLQGRIDVIRAEIVNRGGISFSAEALARVLMGDSDSRPKSGDVS